MGSERQAVSSNGFAGKKQNEMDKRIKNIIFDFGGIIVDLDKQAAVHAFEALGFEARAYINDYVQDGVFALMETGDMSPDEFLHLCAEESRGRCER